MPGKTTTVPVEREEREEREERPSRNVTKICYASEDEKEAVTRPLLIITALVGIVIVIIAFLWQGYGFFDQSISILSFVALGVTALLGVYLYFRMRQIRLCKN